MLTAPSGEEVGRVRKQIPAGPEGYFFRGDVGPHVISTAIGKIGVGICAENYYCFAASQFLKDSADFIVMPHSSPDMSNSGGLPSPPGTHIASWYAKKLGVPVAMVNKVGRSYKPPPNEINGVFPGRSAIIDSDGTVLQSMPGLKSPARAMRFAKRRRFPSQGSPEIFAGPPRECRG